MIVTFSGVDCSGKSTQIELLRAELAKQGRKPVVFWLRPGYSKELDFLRAAVRRLRPGVLPTTEAPRQREQAFARSGVKSTWLAMALIDSIYQYAIKVRTLSLTGHTVICDRYLDDGLLDLRLRFPELAPDDLRLTRLLNSVAPEPDCRFLIDLPQKECRRRQREKNEPFPDPPHIADQRYAHYRKLAATGRYIVLDGAADQLQIHRRIMHNLVGSTGRID